MGNPLRVAELARKSAAQYPGVYGVASKLGNKLCTETGYDMLRALPNGEFDEFLTMHFLVTRQEYDMPEFNEDALVNVGLLEERGLEFGEYIQFNGIGDMPNEDPLLFGDNGTGLKTGQLMLRDRMARVADITQDYTRKNGNYYNHFTWDDITIKPAFLKDDLSLAYSLVWAAIKADYSEWRYNRALSAIHGAFHSVEHPMLDTQKVAIEGFDLENNEEASVRALIRAVKQIVNTYKNVPSVRIYNSDGYRSSLNIKKHKLYVRADLAQYVDDVLAYTFHDGKLDFPIQIEPLPNFGGTYPADAEGNRLQAVYSSGGKYNGVSYGYGSLMGWISADVTVNGYAEEKNGQWVVNVTSGATTADTTFIMGRKAPQMLESEEDASLIAFIAEDGLIMEISQEPLKVESDYIRGYQKSQNHIMKDNVGMCYRFRKNLIGFYAVPKTDDATPDADADSNS